MTVVALEIGPLAITFEADDPLIVLQVTAEMAAKDAAVVVGVPFGSERGLATVGKGVVAPHAGKAPLHTDIAAGPAEVALRCLIVRCFGGKVCSEGGAARECKSCRSSDDHMLHHVTSRLRYRNNKQVRYC